MIETLISAVMNVVIFSLPILVYVLWRRFRSGLQWTEIQVRLGLVQIDRRMLLIALGCSALGAAVAALVGAVALPADLLQSMVEESPHLSSSVRAGLGGTTLVIALLYGYVQSSLAEELFFRGLVAGALGRRMDLWKANLVQALIFGLPHILLVLIDPRLVWMGLSFGFLGGLLNGWLRLESGSVLPSWLVHGTTNATMVLVVVARVG
jgi:membrane protease YdiL (CAAX protease family)